MKDLKVEKMKAKLIGSYVKIYCEECNVELKYSVRGCFTNEYDKLTIFDVYKHVCKKEDLKRLHKIWNRIK